VSPEALNRLILSSGCFSGTSVAGWVVDPAVIGPLGLGLLIYIAGLSRLWRSAGIGHGASLLQAGCFALGWLVMAGALVSPLHETSERFFAAHMIEHELVLVVAAPLLVLSRPLGVLLWAFHRSWRARVARAATLTAYFLGWDILCRPVVATLVHAAAIWFWHIPVFFDAALGNEALHWLEHVSFFVTAMFFWWALLGYRHRAGIALVCLFLTAMHTGALGALLALARIPLYPLQARVAVASGADALTDQQLAGVIMWVPGGVVYLLAGLALAGLWIARSSTRGRLHAGPV
jgi:cytochrome c oxidase assembly factor CtaG